MNQRQKQKLRNWIASCVILTFFFALFFFINKPFENDQKLNGLILILSNSFLPAGVVLLCIPAFIWIGRTGMFDTIVFGIIAFGESFKKDITHKYSSPYQYREVQEKKRREHQTYFLPYFIIGGIALLASLTFAFIFMYM